jgi:1-aminocyclopropane-1-carboxylate deaminase
LSPLEFLPNHPGREQQIQLFIKRDDLIHPSIQGNKWRKLRPLLESFHTHSSARGIITFGGAFSNHLQAVAQAGALYGIETVGILRGIAADLSNPTLREASAAGMKLFPIPKKDYDAKLESSLVQEIGRSYPDHLVLPEGGATPEAVLSCAEISREVLEQVGDCTDKPLFISVSAGTGTTAAGILRGLPAPHQVLVFPAASYGISIETILECSEKVDDRTRVQLITAYIMGKFASPDPRILEFAHWFAHRYHIQLDPIYTARMMFGVFDLLQQGFFPKGSVIVAVHTGGLQGWRGINLP